MYKETIMKKKLFNLIIILVLSILAILLSDYMQTVRIDGQSIGEYSSFVIFIIICVVNIKQLKNCSLKYKYSIIADQFIIYEVSRDNQKVKENIRLDEIKSISKIKANVCRPKNILSRKYICFCKNRCIYKCIYVKQGQERNFLFEPSDSLVSKLNKFKQAY